MSLPLNDPKGLAEIPPAPEAASQGFERELIAPSIAPALYLALTVSTTCFSAYIEEHLSSSGCLLL